MKLRLLRNVRMQGAPSVEIEAGSIVEASGETATRWLKAGVAEIVRTGSIETTELPPAENTMLAAPAKKKSASKK